MKKVLFEQFFTHPHATSGVGERAIALKNDVTLSESKKTTCLIPKPPKAHSPEHNRPRIPSSSFPELPEENLLDALDTGVQFASMVDFFETKAPDNGKKSPLLPSLECPKKSKQQFFSIFESTNKEKSIHDSSNSSAKAILPKELKSPIQKKTKLFRARKDGATIPEEVENRPRTHSVPFSELSEKFLNGDEQPREQEDSLSDDLDTGVQFTSTVYFINSNELDSERKPSSPLGSSEIEVDLLQEIISGSKKRILPKQAIPSPFRIQKNSPSATQEVVEEKHPTIAPKKPLETQLEKKFNRKEACQTDKAQCTANMIMKKTKLPVFKDGVSVYDWDITLSNFAVDVNWLLKTPTSTVSQLCIEQLIPVAQQAMHKKFILSILNRSDKHSGIDWTDLAYMLSRPIAIMHPLTQEKMHVKIAMQYNQIDSSTMEKAEGRKCICMSVTFTQVTIEEYNQKRQATFFVQDELSQRRRQIRFQPLLEEDKIRPSTPPH